MIKDIQKRRGLLDKYSTVFTLRNKVEIAMGWVVRSEHSNTSRVSIVVDSESSCESGFYTNSGNIRFHAKGDILSASRNSA